MLAINRLEWSTVEIEGTAPGMVLRILAD
jgi:hypothetical protein